MNPTYSNLSITVRPSTMYLSHFIVRRSSSSFTSNDAALSFQPMYFWFLELIHQDLTSYLIPPFRFSLQTSDSPGTPLLQTRLISMWSPIPWCGRPSSYPVAYSCPRKVRAGSEEELFLPAACASTRDRPGSKRRSRRQCEMRRSQYVVLRISFYLLTFYICPYAHR